MNRSSEPRLLTLSLAAIALAVCRPAPLFAEPPAPPKPAPAAPAAPAAEPAPEVGELPSGDEEARRGKSDTSAIQKTLTRLNLSREQRQEIHKVIDTADDERVRLIRRSRNAADDVKKMVREKIGGVITDERQAKVKRIIDEELDRAKEARRALREEKGRKPSKAARVALKSFQALKDRIFKEVRMSDAEAEKMLAAFNDIRQAGRAEAEKIHDAFVKLRDDTKAKVLAVLNAEQRTKFDEEIGRIRDGHKDAGK